MQEMIKLLNHTKKLWKNKMRENYLQDRVNGLLYGLAIGDSLGYKKFLSRELGISGDLLSDVEPFKSIKMPISDRTQIALANCQGLMESYKDSDDASMRSITQKLIEYSNNPSSNRSFGSTNLQAISKLSEGYDWTNSGVRGKKSPGALTRTLLTGMVYYDDLERLIRMTEKSSKITHDSKESIAASIAASYLVSMSLRDVDAKEYVPKIIQLTEKICPDFAEQVSKIPSVIEGSNDLKSIKLHSMDINGNCEDIFSISLYYILKNPNSFDEVINNSFNYVNDNASVSFIVGGIVGALNSIRIIPPDMVKNIEQKNNLDQLSRSFALQNKTNSVFLFSGNFLNRVFGFSSPELSHQFYKNMSNQRYLLERAIRFRFNRSYPMPKSLIIESENSIGLASLDIREPQKYLPSKNPLIRSSGNMEEVISGFLGLNGPSAIVSNSNVYPKIKEILLRKCNDLGLKLEDIVNPSLNEQIMSSIEINNI